MFFDNVMKPFALYDLSFTEKGMSSLEIVIGDYYYISLYLTMYEAHKMSGFMRFKTRS